MIPQIPTPRSRPPGRPSVARPALVYVPLFAAVGAWVPYSSVYLQSLGLDLAAIGLLGGLGASVAIATAPAWGLFADRLGDVRPSLVLAAVLAAASAAALARVPEGALIPLEVALIAAGSSAMSPLVDARTVELLGDDRERYGRARVWGSLSFIVAALAVGVLTRATGPRGLFVAYCPALLVAGLVGWLVLGRGGRVAGPPLDLRRAAGLLADRRLAVFFLGCMLVWTASAAVLTFLSLRLVEIGADPGVIGLAWAVNAVVEIPLMLRFHDLARRFGVHRLLVLGALAFALRAAGWAVTDSTAAFLVVATLGGTGFALFYVGTVTYVAAAAPPGVRATAQGLFSGTTFAAGSILGSVLGGQLGAGLGLPQMFGVCAAASAVAAVIVWRATRPVALP